MHLRHPALLAFCLLLCGCASSGMSSEDRSAIPKDATTVVLHSEVSPDSLYATAYRMLRLRGFRFSEAEEERRSLATEGLSVGQSMETLRLSIIVEPAGEAGSLLYATGEFDMAPFGWRPALFTGGAGSRFKLAFEEMALLVRDLPHVSYEYIADDERRRRALSL